jgi:hypothetical protein
LKSLSLEAAPFLSLLSHTDWRVMLCGDSAVSGPQVTSTPLSSTESFFSTLDKTLIFHHVCILLNYLGFCILIKKVPLTYLSLIVISSIFAGQRSAELRKFPEEESSACLVERNHSVFF